ncbi:MAG: transglutaminase-like domain-containing protein [Eubacteriales bacterium]|nr:transglutaminase-like domain-containing protein [Lachnospiraceae bacterium]MDO5126900.1 transglutaminase-like domain-containing protein [Eubacteriales bacterium]
MGKRFSSFFRMLTCYIWISACVCFLDGCGKKVSNDAFSLEKQSPVSMKDTFGEFREPDAPGTRTQGNDCVTIDISNASEGYCYVTYTGTNQKVKLQLTGPDALTYTYNIKNEPACLPLTAGNGKYTIAIFENISGTEYSTAYSGDFEVTVENSFGPFLYPNLYVNFDHNSKAVQKSNELAATTTSDLALVEAVYHFVTSTIVYDKEEAQTVAYDYLPDVDEVLSTKKGICFDYAALMAAMLRCQSIPTRLEIGYAKDAYHAWISVYIEDKGWIDGIIEFDGSHWSLMDPTFAASDSSESDVKEFIGDGSNYNTLYTY